MIKEVLEKTDALEEKIQALLAEEEKNRGNQSFTRGKEEAFRQLLRIWSREIGCFWQDTLDAPMWRTSFPPFLQTFSSKGRPSL